MASALRSLEHVAFPSLFKGQRLRYRKVKFEEEVANVRDSDQQILDATEADSGREQETGTVVGVDVPTANLLDGRGISSEAAAAPQSNPDVRPKPSRILFGCLNFNRSQQARAVPQNAASKGKQKILNRLAQSAKKPVPTQAFVKPAKPPKRSPYVLHAAAWRTNMSELRTLVADGANVSKRDKAGLMPLTYAAWQGSVDAVELLLQHGADVNSVDPEGMVALHFAAWFNRLDVAALLLDNGSLINPPSKGSLWPTTPVIFAAKMGHANMVALLMDRGATVDAAYKAASSALHEAAWAGHANVVEAMLTRGVSHDLATSKSKYRALHLAAMSGNHAVVSTLLQAGAWVDARSQLGRTPLHVACEKGHVAAAAALVAGGADLLAKDRRGFTPLHLAIDNNHVCLAKLLLDKGATPDAADAHGALPLHFAHDPDCFKLLRAVRWYGAASVPSGNNPISSRYVSTNTSQTAVTAAATGASTTANNSADAAIVAASKTAGGWLRTHLPHRRSRAAAVAAAAAQRGNSVLSTPETTASIMAAAPTDNTQQATGASGAMFAPAIATDRAALGNSSAAAEQGGNITEHEEVRVAAAAVAHAAVQAVLVRAAADAAAAAEMVTGGNVSDAAVPGAGLQREGSYVTAGSASPNASGPERGQTPELPISSWASAETTLDMINPQTASHHNSTNSSATASEARAGLELPATKSAADIAVASDGSGHRASPRQVDFTPTGAGGGYLSPERDSADDAQLLQQIRTALGHTAAAAIMSAGRDGHTPANSFATELTGVIRSKLGDQIVGQVAGDNGVSGVGGDGGSADDKVQLEDYLRPPASISINAPKTQQAVEQDVAGGANDQNAAADTQLPPEAPAAIDPIQKPQAVSWTIGSQGASKKPSANSRKRVDGSSSGGGNPAAAKDTVMTATAKRDIGGSSKALNGSGPSASSRKKASRAGKSKSQGSTGAKGPPAISST